jgi:hypothetical protein
MEGLLQRDEEETGSSKMSRQVISFFSHTALALGSWLVLMFIGYALNPVRVPQFIILVLSIVVPLGVAFLVTRYRQEDIATSVWLVGLIWVLIISLWILDMPTGPNECFHCDATEKLSRTFFSLPKPSGLIDNDGPFLGTWPAAALLGYSIGARISLRRSKQTS